LQLLGSFLSLALSCFVARGEETSLAALTLDSEQAPARVTSLLSDNFSISVALDFVPDASSELLSGSSIGYRRASVASIRHLADPGETTNKLVLFPRHVQPGITSLAWGSFQAGYGRIFTDDSVITRRSNGTAWEEPGCLYLKTRFGF
jgi:hypothetical protein